MSWLTASHGGEDGWVEEESRLCPEIKSTKLYIVSDTSETLKYSCPHSHLSEHPLVMDGHHRLLTWLVHGSAAAFCNLKKLSPSKQPIFSNFSSYSEDAVKFPGDIYRNIIFHRTSACLFSLHEESSQRKLEFYGCEKKENMRITLVSTRIFYLKVCEVIQRDRKNNRFQRGCPSPWL